MCLYKGSSSILPYKVFPFSDISGPSCIALLKILINCVVSVFFHALALLFPGVVVDPDFTHLQWILTRGPYNPLLPVYQCQIIDRICADICSSLQSLSSCVAGLCGPDNPASTAQPPTAEVSATLIIEYYSFMACRCGSFLLQYSRFFFTLFHRQGENRVYC